MRLVCGTSGYSYKEWKGSFYPESLPASKMLSFYAENFGGVEINNTFYRMPDAKTLERWRSDVPETFVFALKLPQRITHQKKLADVSDDVTHFLSVASTLGPNLGPLLVQLPPWFRKDEKLLDGFLGLFPGNVRLAVEFRHASWQAPEVNAILRAHDAALCAAETDEDPDPDALVAPTAGWGYLRLRKTAYAPGELPAWRERIARQPWSEAFVFFKHEDEAKGPAFAREFLADG